MYIKMLSSKIPVTSVIRCKVDKRFNLRNLSYTHQYYPNALCYYDRKRNYHFISSKENEISSKDSNRMILQRRARSSSVHSVQSSSCAKALRQTIFQNAFTLPGLSTPHKNLIRQFSSSSNTSPDFSDFVTPHYGGVWQLFSQSKPVLFVQDCLMDIHSYTGLPWWAIIILSSVTTRFVLTLPLSIIQQNNIAKLSNAKYEMDEVVQGLKREANFSVSRMGYDQVSVRKVYDMKVRAEWKNIIIRDNCHPVKNYIILLGQIPLWLIMSRAIINMCFVLPECNLKTYTTYQELSREGFGWISDLTHTDPFFVLPIMLGAMNLLNAEMHHMLLQGEISQFQRYVHYCIRGLFFLFVPIAAYLPAGTCLLWITSSVCGSAQTLLLLSPKFRRLVRIPICAEEREKPYTDLCRLVKNMFYEDEKSSIRHK